MTGDIDILKKTTCTVALSITTDSDEISRRPEPHALTSSERLEAIEALVKDNLPVAVRIDPITLFLSDKPKKLIESLASLGVSHVTSSTYKVKPNNWRRFSKAFPHAAERLHPFYFEEGEGISRYFYLSRNLRHRLMKRDKELIEKTA